MLCLTCSASPGARVDRPLARAPRLPLHDCNANGVEDAVDIARGTSSDADLDGVPDECQERKPAHAAPTTPEPRHRWGGPGG
jgi:hypothetical protein